MLSWTSSLTFNLLASGIAGPRHWHPGARDPALHVRAEQITVAPLMFGELFLNNYALGNGHA